MTQPAPPGPTPASAPRSRRSTVGLSLAVLVALAVAGLGMRALDVEAGTPGAGPDVTVLYLGSIDNSYGSSGGIRAYAVGTTSCNIGTEPLWWCNDTGPGSCDGDDPGIDPDVGPEKHPVIAQNLYRLKNGRFEQIGMSWLKHGFFSTNFPDGACGSCTFPPAGGDQLGVGCTDTYGAGLNGGRPLGLRSEVNATTGDFPYPYSVVGTTTAIDQRLQVAESDLDPALNPGAKYWVEGQYIASDDAAAENAFNNASYREVTVSAGSLNLTLQGSTIRELPAIAAWQVEKPTVELVAVDVPTFPTQRFNAARLVTDNGDGTWHYEYAIHNMNADLAARAFVVTIPGASFTGVGFSGPVHHSGEPYDTTPWAIAVDAPSSTVTWSTDTFAPNPDANALRWGTMFTFWFDADRLPGGGTSHSLELFKDATPQSVTVPFAESSIFYDGFESGDVSHWDGSAP